MDKKDTSQPSVLPNRPGEPDFKLEITQEFVPFNCTADRKPVWFDIKIKNITKDKQTFKVKCTSADIFRVQPPIGFAKVDETVTVRIWFQNKAIPDGQKHYFAIYHMKCAEGKNIKDVWTKTSKADGIRRLSAVFNPSQ